MATQKQIENYAYQLWEKAGRPQGRDHEFYYAAKAELDAEDENSRGRKPHAGARNDDQTR